MNWDSERGAKESQLTLELSNLEPNEQTVLFAIRKRKVPVMIDELSLQTGLSQGSLSSLLLSLEFKNAVVSLPGKMYKEK